MPISNPAGESKNDQHETPNAPTTKEASPTTWQTSESRFTSKRYSEYFDPCQEKADRSLKCLRRNGGDRAMCTDYFEAYKECKKGWMEEMKEAKRKAKQEKGGWFS